jgi:hypothetical protein
VDSPPFGRSAVADREDMKIRSACASPVAAADGVRCKRMGDPKSDKLVAARAVAASASDVNSTLACPAWLRLKTRGVAVRVSWRYSAAASAFGGFAGAPVMWHMIIRRSPRGRLAAHSGDSAPAAK